MGRGGTCKNLIGFFGFLCCFMAVHSFVTFSHGWLPLDIWIFTWWLHYFEKSVKFQVWGDGCSCLGRRSSKNVLPQINIIIFTMLSQEKMDNFPRWGAGGLGTSKFCWYDESKICKTCATSRVRDGEEMPFPRGTFSCRCVVSKRASIIIIPKRELYNVHRKP